MKQTISATKWKRMTTDLQETKAELKDTKEIIEKLERDIDYEQNQTRNAERSTRTVNDKNVELEHQVLGLQQRLDAANWGLSSALVELREYQIAEKKEKARKEGFMMPGDSLALATGYAQDAKTSNPSQVLPSKTRKR